VGTYLRDGLSGIECEAMGDVRGHGLFIGLDWVSDRKTKEPDSEGAKRFVNRLKEKGFLTSNAGASFNVLKLRPPLVFGRDHADLFLTAFEETVRELY
jgi:4-aminobutyrate aminotransferase-like enzyme